MDLPNPDAFQVGATLASAFVAYFAAFKVALPLWRWCIEVGSSIKDAAAIFGGRAEYIDPVTGKKHDEVPPLGLALAEIRDKQDDMGKEITDLTAVVTQVADQQITLNEHTRQINDLRLADAIRAEQIGLLKLAASERTETAKAATAALNLVRDEQTVTAEQKPEAN